MMRFLGRMMLLPLTAFVYGLEAFTKSIWEVQKISEEGLRILPGSNGPAGQARTSRTGSLVPRAMPGAWIIGEGSTRAPYPIAKEEKPTVWNPDAYVERRAQWSQDGSENDLKLVRYWVYFDKRDYEVILQDPKPDLVLGKESAEEFRGKKKAEFLRSLESVKRPSKWEKKRYPPGAGEMIKLIPPDDEEYVQVHVEVVLQRPRRDADYDRQKVEVLEKISDKLA